MGGTAVINSAELETESLWRRIGRKLFQRINGIDNMDFLEFISNMLDAFKEKWGI